MDAVGTWVLVIVALVFGVALGIIINHAQWHARIKMKAEKEHRTADYVDGAFYYYIPEDELLRDYLSADRGSRVRPQGPDQ